MTVNSFKFKTRPGRQRVGRFWYTLEGEIKWDREPSKHQRKDKDWWPGIIVLDKNRGVFVVNWSKWNGGEIPVSVDTNWGNIRNQIADALRILRRGGVLEWEEVIYYQCFANTPPRRVMRAKRPDDGYQVRIWDKEGGDYCHRENVMPPPSYIHSVHFVFPFSTELWKLLKEIDASTKKLEKGAYRLRCLNRFLVKHKDWKQLRELSVHYTELSKKIWDLTTVPILDQFVSELERGEI